ncbi:Protein of unknown function [Micromonospora pattaloongensis]|uniref:DUF2795 domain-containing protein n=1 Tax=Micromonospora pattaloongensis TaxID=405436 RepID=A0A1H3I6M9_9ACTN|nr:DUF2795 domain-containing protein [Micromonospora pattaloongensis]SDY23301.1 Protein of unknown function [Micromonospora pattaloongensis]
MVMVTNEEVLRYLKTLDFPMDKWELVRQVEQQGAPQHVLKALRALPPLDYRNKNEVVRSAATALAPEVGPPERAERARYREHQEVAQHLRER